jgi:hypothetical protein
LHEGVSAAEVVTVVELDGGAVEVVGWIDVDVLELVGPLGAAGVLTLVDASGSVDMLTD